MMRARSLPIAGVAALALAASAPAGTGAATIPGCDRGGPVVAHHAGGDVVPTPAGQLPRACATRTDFATSETTIAVTPKGTVLLSPAQTENSLTRSTDGGAHWELSSPNDEQYTALWNTVDPILTVDWRTGRLFWVHATGATRTLPVIVSQSPLPNGVPTIVAAASGFQVYRSSDEGHSWLTADYQTAPMGDWEKLIVGPPRANASQAERPTGYPDVVYVCGNSPFEVSGPGRICYRSLDGGATFAIAGYVTPSPNMPADVCPPLAANSGVVDSAGILYQPVSCNGGAYVAVSEDEGASYVFRAVPDAPPSNGLSGSLQIAVDRADTLYAMWISGDELRMALSRDQARTWSRPLAISAPGVHVITRPAPAAGARGQFGAAYYGSTDPKAKKLTLYVTQTADALDGDPLWISGALNDPAQPIYVDGGVTGPTPRADYVGAAFDGDGTLWAGAVEQLSAPDANNFQQTTGYVGRLVPRTPGASQPPAKARRPACRRTRRLVYLLGRVPGHRHDGRVVRVVVQVNGRRVLERHGRNLRRVAIVRPPGRDRRYTVRIVTYNAAGGGVVTTRSYRGCTRTRLISRPFRRPHRH